MSVMNVSAQEKGLTSPDTEIIPLRSCRMGTPNPHFARHRSPSLQNGENPYVGDRHQLVVLASFQDRGFKEDRDATLTTWDKIFNATNYDEDMYAGSVHDYFMAQSYGQFNLTFDLVFVDLPDGCIKYKSNSNDDENSQYMVDDIVDVLQTQDIDWSLYDWDGDAFVDQLLIIYAGEGMNATREKNTIWPHQWWLSQHLNLETENINDYRSFRTVNNGDKEYYIDCYCCVQERVNYSNIKSSFGTICHEYSHCFGFPDFYYGSGTQVLGEWDLMDNGNYNGSGFHPCNYSAHERMLMGWLTPVELTDPTSITDMPALCDEPQSYIIRNDAVENEYYIIENRQQRGWDMLLPGNGILVFHIDYDKNIWTSSISAPNSYYLKRYHIFPANEKAPKIEKKGWAYPYIVTDELGNDSIANDELTNTSEPAATLNHANIDGEKLMSKPVTKMFVNEDGLASFDFFGGDPSGIEAITDWSDRSSRPSGWYTLDGRRLKGKPAARGLYIHQGKKVVIP